MDKKTGTIYKLSKRDTHQNKRYTHTKSKGVEKIFHANRNEQKTGLAILITDKIGFKTKVVVRNAI